MPDRPSAAGAADDDDDYGFFDDDRSAAYAEFRQHVKAAKRRGRPSVAARRSSSFPKLAVSGEPLHSSPPPQTTTPAPLEADAHLVNGYPGYISDRRIAFGKLEVDAAGVRTLPPPRTEGHDLSNSRPADLPVKPQLPHLQPVRERKDVSLGQSHGVIPGPIAQWLRDYQIAGARFLYDAYSHQKGCILGDDMGLGKTIQVICFLTAAFGKTADSRDGKRMRKARRFGSHFYPIVLIVCPGSLMDNWMAELAAWGWWEVYRFHGPAHDKDACLEAAQQGMAEIVITTYTTYTKNADLLNGIEWSCVIADECHMIKSRQAVTTIAMNAVNALCRIGLTGTAIQNDYAELWTLLNWSNPGHFATLADWETHIFRPLRLGQAHDASVKQLARTRTIATRLAREVLPLVFLRRMKTLLRDQLPKKTDRVVFCPMSEQQRISYNNLASGLIISHVRRVADKCDCGSGRTFGWCCGATISLDDDDGGSEHSEPSSRKRKWQTYVFPAITSLQKAANHLCLLLPSSNDPVERQKIDLSWLKQACPDEWRDMNGQRDRILFPAHDAFCGKWVILKGLLELWHVQGDKVLIFSHSVRLLRMLRMLFTTSTSYTVAYLDGSMSYADRTATVARFCSDPHQFVFLISAKAGGVGLNITAANKVVVVDPNWNPAYDQQAQDRAYRIGQVKDVDVYRLVSVGTIEEIVYARQIYKHQLANVGYDASVERRYFCGVQKEADKQGEIFGLHNLLARTDERDRGSGGILHGIVNKTNIAESAIGASIADFVSPEQDGGDGQMDEDSAIRTLVSDIQTGKTGFDDRSGGGSTRAPVDPVDAILAAAGAEYSHNNAEVVGSSTVETALSRQAVAKADQTRRKQRRELKVTRAETALPDDTDGKFQSDDEPVIPFFPSHDASDSPEWLPVFSLRPSKPEGRQIKFKPPDDVCHRQFRSMAKFFGFPTPTAFALEVESATQSRRRAMLDQFYKSLRSAIDANDESTDSCPETDVQVDDGTAEGGSRSETDVEDAVGDRRLDGPTGLSAGSSLTLPSCPAPILPAVSSSAPIVFPTRVVCPATGTTVDLAIELETDAPEDATESGDDDTDDEL